LGAIFVGSVSPFVNVDAIFGGQDQRGQMPLKMCLSGLLRNKRVRPAVRHVKLGLDLVK
jgi:hypothetical protein